jgi:hydrogenase expression/formation protein HypE
MTLPPGKIPINILKDVVFKNLGAFRKEVTLGPKAGVDCAVIEAGHKSMVISMDPITGAVERIGWLAVNINANDIATFGVEPAFLFSCLMLPEGSDRSIIEAISSQMNEAACALGMAIVGGHAEITPGLAHPIVVGCAMGFTEKGQYVTAANAKAGDAIILTKSAGIEGTAILALDRAKDLRKILGTEALKNAQNFYKKISVVQDALTAFKVGGVDAMHDPTEGGVVGGIFEMTEAAKLGVEVYAESIMVEPETQRICNHFKIEPLQLIGSGALLIAAERGKTSQIIEALTRKQIPAKVIGKFTNDSSKRTLIQMNEKTCSLSRPLSDHLWLALSK